MMIAEKKEFIGKSAKMFAFNREFSGKIVDETMHMIGIEDKNGRRISLPKKVSRMEIDNCSIDGRNIECRSWERTEKARKKKRVMKK